jgi:hypothetical protein
MYGRGRNMQGVIRECFGDCARLDVKPRKPFYFPVTGKDNNITIGYQFKHFQPVFLVVIPFNFRDNIFRRIGLEFPRPDGFKELPCFPAVLNRFPKILLPFLGEIEIEKRCFNLSLVHTKLRITE